MTLLLPSRLTALSPIDNLIIDPYNHRARAPDQQSGTTLAYRLIVSNNNNQSDNNQSDPSLTPVVAIAPAPAPPSPTHQGPRARACAAARPHPVARRPPARRPPPYAPPHSRQSFVPSAPSSFQQQQQDTKSPWNRPLIDNHHPPARRQAAHPRPCRRHARFNHHHQPINTTRPAYPARLSPDRIQSLTPYASPTRARATANLRNNLDQS